MNPFEETSYQLEDKAAIIQDLMKKFKLTEEEAQIQIEKSTEGRVYKNDIYTVLVKDVPSEKNYGAPDMIWLSIKRNDREAIHDWRDMQTIKNMLVGPENEGVELYPAESRLVDTANQYHIFVIKDPKTKFPFGFHEGRFVDDSEPFGKAKQRKF